MDPNLPKKMRVLISVGNTVEIHSMWSLRSVCFSLSFTCVWKQVKSNSSSHNILKSRTWYHVWFQKFLFSEEDGQERVIKYVYSIYSSEVCDSVRLRKDSREVLLYIFIVLCFPLCLLLAIIRDKVELDVPLN